MAKELSLHNASLFGLSLLLTFTLYQPNPRRQDNRVLRGEVSHTVIQPQVPPPERYHCDHEYGIGGKSCSRYFPSWAQFRSLFLVFVRICVSGWPWLPTHCQAFRLESYSMMLWKQGVVRFFPSTRHIGSSSSPATWNPRMRSQSASGSQRFSFHPYPYRPPGSFKRADESLSRSIKHVGVI